MMGVDPANITLPIDIQETIVDKIGAQFLSQDSYTRGSLGNIALASRDLRNRSHIYLFRNLMLYHLTGVRVPSKSRFMKKTAALFKSNTRLFEYVRNVHLNIRVGSKTLVKPVDLLFLIDGVLQYRRVESLTMDSMLGLPTDWAAIDKDTRSIICRLLTGSTSLNIVNIAYIHLPSAFLEVLPFGLDGLQFDRLNVAAQSVEAEGTDRSIFSDDLSVAGWVSHPSKGPCSPKSLMFDASSEPGMCLIRAQPTSFFDHLTNLTLTILRDRNHTGEVEIREANCVRQLMLPTVRRLALDIMFTETVNITASFKHENIVLNNFEIPPFPEMPHLEELTIQMDLLGVSTRKSFAPVLFPVLVIDYLLVAFSSIHRLNLSFFWVHGRRVEAPIPHPKLLQGLASLDKWIADNTDSDGTFPHLQEVHITSSPPPRFIGLSRFRRAEVKVAEGEDAYIEAIKATFVETPEKVHFFSTSNRTPVLESLSGRRELYPGMELLGMD